MRLSRKIADRFLKVIRFDKNIDVEHLSLGKLRRNTCGYEIDSLYGHVADTTGGKDGVDQFKGAAENKLLVNPAPFIGGTNRLLPCQRSYRR